jgi:NNP family nitrate/nitrite transporter-like MFS transporter
MAVLGLAIVSMVVFSVFVQMAEGATFGLVPFVNRKALGAVAGIVGAGGNAGAVAAGFLFRTESLSYGQALLFLGVAVVVCSLAALAVRFSPEVRAAEHHALHEALAERVREAAGAGRTAQAGAAVAVGAANAIAP